MAQFSEADEALYDKYTAEEIGARQVLAELRQRSVEVNDPQVLRAGDPIAIGRIHAVTAAMRGVEQYLATLSDLIAQLCDPEFVRDRGF